MFAGEHVSVSECDIKQVGVSNVAQSISFVLTVGSFIIDVSNHKLYD